MPLKVNRNFATLYGIMLGDGCLSLVYGKKKYISIAGNLHDDIPFFVGTVQPIIKSLIHKEIPIKYKKSRGNIEINFYHTALFNFLASFEFPIGKKGNKLGIPNVFYNKDLTKYVIRGFFATDGSLVLTNNNATLYPRVEANGIAKDLIYEIHKFLCSRGIKCHFYEAKRKIHHWDNWQQQYRLQINGKDNLKKFINQIGFINPKQIEKLEKYYGCTKN